MTEPLTLLIVEDETLLAEMHAEYIRHIPGFSQIWLAGNLAQARMMIERFKPGLILLDNYLPDGKGITLLHELTQTRYPGGVVRMRRSSLVMATISVLPPWPSWMVALLIRWLRTSSRNSE